MIVFRRKILSFDMACAHNGAMKNLWIAMGLIFLSACGGVSGVKGLQENTEKFQRNIRWNSVKGASVYMDPEFKSELLDYYGRWVKNNKTVEYSILGMQMNEAKNKAQVIVEFSYYEIVYETLKSTRQQQTWEYNRDQKKWMIVAVSP